MGICIVGCRRKNTRSLDSEVESRYRELKDKLLPSAIQFAESLNLSLEDVESMTGVEINNNEELEDTFVGLMLFATMTDFSLANDGPQTKGKSFMECFTEATSIAAGAAVVGGLVKGTMSKEAIKAAVKIVAKVGTRTLSGVGLALIAAEIAWCMW